MFQSYSAIDDFEQLQLILEQVLTKLFNNLILDRKKKTI